jgi:hypothetical protein
MLPLRRETKAAGREPLVQVLIQFFMFDTGHRLCKLNGPTGNVNIWNNSKYIHCNVGQASRLSPLRMQNPPGAPGPVVAPVLRSLGGEGLAEPGVPPTIATNWVRFSKRTHRFCDKTLYLRANPHFGFGFVW